MRLAKMAIVISTLGLVVGILIIAHAQKAEGAHYRVIVNYGQNLDQMIEAGHYDYVNYDITVTNFPFKKKGMAEVSIKLVHFNRSIGSEEAIGELKKMGLRPATLPELLAFGAKYPRVQCQFPIAALGSVWQGGYGLGGVPYLWGSYAGERRLDLTSVQGRWDWNYRFAAVRK
jgi:hypothetical protein